MKRGRVFKWFVRIAVLLVVVGGVAVFVLYHRANSDPAWYPKRETDPAVLEKAAARVENTLIEMRNWAGEWAAADARAVRATQPGRSSRAGMALPAPAAEFTAVIRGEELTAFVLKWTKLQGWDEGYKKWVDDPAIAIVEGRIVIVGRVKDAGATVSLHYRPELVDGGKTGERMAFHLERVMLGRLPVPASVGQEQLERTAGALASALAKWRADAKLNSAGLGNNPAMLASVGNVARGLVSDVAVADAGFVPVTEKACLPVVFTKLEIGENEMKVTLRPVKPDERPEFMAGLKRD